VKGTEKRAKYRVDVAWRLVTLVLHLNGKATKLCEVLFYAFGFLSLESERPRAHQIIAIKAALSLGECCMLNVECRSI